MPRDRLGSIVFRYSSAVFSVGVAVAVRFLLHPLLGDDAPFTTFYLAVFVVAYFCGAGPAAVATVLGAFTADYFFLPPLRSFVLALSRERGGVWLALYFLNCGVVIVLIHALTAARRVAEDARRALKMEIDAHLASNTERNRLLALIDLDHDAIITASPERLIQGWSAGARATYGWTAAEAKGQVLGSFLGTDPALAAAISAALSAEGRWEGEIVQKRKDGTEVIVESRQVVTVDASGAPQAILEINRDITQRKRTEERLRLKQKLDSIGFLAAGLAHDINNLMTVVCGNCSLLLERASGEEAAQLSAALRAADRASQLTHQLVAYAGKGSTFAVDTQINDVIERSADLLRADLPGECRLEFSLAGQLPVVFADPSQLQQLITNLVLNAAEAIPAGSQGLIVVRTGLARVEASSPELQGELAEGECVFVEVADNGIGMDAETRAKIFDPFFSTKFLGRGLGLAAVAGIVRAHGGAISVQSTHGAGTTFKVFFPPSERVRQRMGLRAREAEGA
jgi:PAS domain S-box-containing protein